MNIRVLGAHNRESEDTKFAGLLVDDVLALDAGGLASSLSFSAQRKLAAIFLTHHHYDHTKDIPVVAMNFLVQSAVLDVYASKEAYDLLASHLLDGQLYPDFRKQPAEKPTLKFNFIEAGQTKQIGDYQVLALSISHAASSLGYQVTAADDKAVLYTGDTGADLAQCWQQISPQLLITEITLPDEYEARALQTGHLTPKLLKQELLKFRDAKGYIPRVITVHMSPALEKEIRDEAMAVARELNASIELADEGMLISL